MPLRDSTKRPYDGPRYLESLHGVWPTYMGRYLNARLPQRYHVESRIHLGRIHEFDVATYENEEVGFSKSNTATALLPEPTLIQSTETPDESEYELRIYDDELGRLVAILELVSPSNKDSPKSRSALAMKCANHWKHQVSVSLVDVVEHMKFNIYADAIDLIGHEDPAFGGKGVPRYAATFRARNGLPDNGWRLESWAYPLNHGERLPSLPMFLSHGESILLDLDETYELAHLEFRLDKIPGAA